MKRIPAIFLAVLLVLACAGCGSDTLDATQQPENETPSASVDENKPSSAVGTLEGFPWTVELRNAQIKDALHTAAGLEQYDGSIVDVDYDNAPSEGQVFLILTLTISKTGTGGGSFDWTKLSLLDDAGNAYGRMENDTFLQNHQYNRLASTPLQIGEHKGSICFEIPSDRADKAFTLQYDVGDVGTLELSVSPS